MTQLLREVMCTGPAMLEQSRREDVVCVRVREAKGRWGLGVVVVGEGERDTTQRVRWEVVQGVVAWWADGGRMIWEEVWWWIVKEVVVEVRIGREGSEAEAVLVGRSELRLDGGGANGTGRLVVWCSLGGVWRWAGVTEREELGDVELGER